MWSKFNSLRITGNLQSVALCGFLKYANAIMQVFDTWELCSFLTLSEVQSEIIPVFMDYRM